MCNEILEGRFENNATTWKIMYLHGFGVDIRVPWEIPEHTVPCQWFEDGPVCILAHGNCIVNFSFICPMDLTHTFFNAGALVILSGKLFILQNFQPPLVLPIKALVLDIPYFQMPFGGGRETERFCLWLRIIWVEINIKFRPVQVQMGFLLHRTCKSIWTVQKCGPRATSANK